MNPLARSAVAASAALILGACAPAAQLNPPASPAPAAGACSPAQLDALTGLSFEVASARLNQAGVRHRVVRDGDQNFPVTLDFDHQRVGLELKDGVVIAARCG